MYMDIKPVFNPGAIPSKPDYRAQLVAAAVAASTSLTAPILPEALQTDFQKLGILNQNQTPACVSHAMANLIKLWYFLKTGTIVNFSPRFLHVMSGLPQYNGGWAAGPEDGRDPITVAKIAMQYGCATETTCPNDTMLANDVYFSSSVLTPAAMAEATNYKIPGYVQIPVEQIAFRQAIQKYGAISMLMRISTAWWTAPNGTLSYAQADIDPVRAPANTAAVIGGHELIGAGWTNESIEHLVNSWGAVWAEQGEADYLWNEWQPYIVEALAIAELDTTTLNLIQGLPRPDEFKHNFITTLTQGQTSDEVRALQIALSIDGEFTYPEITGYYGPITAKAVMVFQAKHNVPDENTNGNVVGPLTRAQLNSLFNS